MSTSSSTASSTSSTTLACSSSDKRASDGSKITLSCSLSPKLSEDEELCGSDSNIPDDTVVKLNVGGTKYYTTKGTLVNPNSRNFFTGMFSGKFPTVKDKEGHLFIDRNGRLFEPILEYLRTGKFHLFGFDKEQVEAEAFFYGVKIEGLSIISDETLQRELSLARNKVEDKMILSKEVVSPARRILARFMELAKAGKDPVSPFFLESRQAMDEKVKEFRKKYQIQTMPSWIKLIVSAKTADCIELGVKYESFKEISSFIQRYLAKHHQVTVTYEEKLVHVNRGMIGDGFYFYNFSEFATAETTISFPLCIQFTWQGQKLATK